MRALFLRLTQMFYLVNNLSLSFYVCTTQGQICYIRDVVEPAIKVGAFGLVLANLAAKAINMTPPPAPK